MRRNRRGGVNPIGGIVLLAAVAGALFTGACSNREDPSGVGDTVVLEETHPAFAAAAGPVKEWTVLLYGSADAGPMYNPLSDFASEFPSGISANSLCFVDTYGETAKMWYIDSDHNPVLLEDVGEVNMGSVTTLTDFLQYAKTNYPAERYILSFYGHGGAWGGACTDMDPSFGVLRMPAIKQALEDAGGVDLVMFSAPCLMGALEAAYQLRDNAEAYIASENLSGYMYWHSAMARISGELDANPDVDSIELAGKIIGWIEEAKKTYVRWGGYQMLTMSAIRMDRMDELRMAIDELALAYFDDPARLRNMLDTIRKKIESFDSTWVADLNSFLTLLHKEETDSAIREKIENVMQRLEESVIAEIHHPQMKDVGGLTIFLPEEADADLLPHYVNEVFGLDFAQDSQWDELLAELFPQESNIRRSTGRSIPRLLQAGTVRQPVLTGN